MRTNILALILCLSYSCIGQNNLELIESTISELKSESPNHEGAVLNTYSIRDLNNDEISVRCSYVL